MRGYKYDAHRFGWQHLRMEHRRDNGSHYDFTCCKYHLYCYCHKCRLYSYCQQHGYSYAIAYAKHQRYKYNLCRY